MTKDKALKLALEALEMCEAPWTGTLDHNLTEAIDAIKQALAAPVQEPVAVVKVLPLGDGNKPMHWADWTDADNPPPEGALLHTAAQRKPLTGEQTARLINKHYHWNGAEQAWCIDGFGLTQAVEAAHGIKENT